MSAAEYAETFTPWWDQARCKGSADRNYDPFYADHEAAGGKAICKGCPVSGECLADALARGDEWGIYGGLTATERAGLAR